MESEDDNKDKPKVETKLKIEEKKEEPVVVKQSVSEIKKENPKTNGNIVTQQTIKQIKKVYAEPTATNKIARPWT